MNNKLFLNRSRVTELELSNTKRHLSYNLKTQKRSYEYIVLTLEVAMRHEFH